MDAGGQPYREVQADDRAEAVADEDHLSLIRRGFQHAIQDLLPDALPIEVHSQVTEDQSDGPGVEWLFLMRDQSNSMEILLGDVVGIRHRALSQAAIMVRP